jgi:hypothetical protein
MANATYYQDPTEKAATAARVPNADVDGGGNKAGSNACGLGINVAGGDVTGDWTIPDQHGVARSPQDSAHVGEGSTGLTTEGPGAVPINVTDNDAEVNDTVSLTVLATGWEQNTVA